MRRSWATHLVGQVSRLLTLVIIVVLAALILTSAMILTHHPATCNDGFRAPTGDCQVHGGLREGN